MMYDLIEVTPKRLNIKKVIICVMIILLILSSVAIFVLYKNGVFNKEKSSEIEQKVSEKQEKITHNVKFIKPIVIKETKNIVDKVNSIYESEEKRVFLTFDDGPSRTVTPLILDLLKEEGIKATFFELGSRVELNPDITKRVYDEGHYVANHGYSHVYKNIYQSVDTVVDEYNQAEQAIKSALGKPEYNSYLFRFPGGSFGGRYHNLKQEAKAFLNENGISCLDWNALSGDAEGKNTIEDLLRICNRYNR